MVSVYPVLHYEENYEELLAELQQYDYHFENLVFSGGAIKTTSFFGGIKVLDELGVLKQCKNFAATSGGSVVATLLALDLDLPSIRKVLDSNMAELIDDHSYGRLSLLPNVANKYGWNPANKWLDEIKSIIEEHTGNAYITFAEAYKRYKKSLCLVSANVSTMKEEYFHHKTTPDFPIVLAVRSTNSLPVYLQPVLYEQQNSFAQYFVDGGLTANFPLHCFDGWFLSMDSDDSFFNKMGSEEAPFEGFNAKTLGFVLYSAVEAEFLQPELYNRERGQELKRPDTALARQKQGYCDKILKENAEIGKVVSAGKAFLQTLKDLDCDRFNGITITTFQKAFEKLKDTKYGPKLFGENFHIEDMFKYLDRDKDGEITFDELCAYMNEQGVPFRALVNRGMPRHITDITGYSGTLLNTVLTMTQNTYVKEHDIDRTVGVYHDYIDTTDFSVIDADREFLIRQGVVGTMMYFKELLEKHKSKQLPKEMQGVIKPKHQATWSLSSALKQLWRSRDNYSFPWGTRDNPVKEEDETDY